MVFDITHCCIKLYRFQFDNLLFTMICNFFLIFAISSQFILCQDAPRITPFNFPTNPMIGRSILVYCLAETGTQPIRYQWLRNNQPIDETNSLENGIKQIVEPITNAFGLIIQSVEAKHSGNYTCSASNLFGDDKFTSPLIIKGPPIWMNTSNSVIDVQHDQPLNLFCLAGGFPIPIISWKKIDQSKPTNS
ncbi:cell adhesion molecule Dscam2-like isoform X2 [Panonychus citri]|uniref:cell adhesion molecule Dscam2-like n=1 Tax=Panonychus citri TaxID=50023 RepID=UPI0023080DF3|nr:cell adhesion molecule Dscam2-like [Panonychus citri]XP_053206722.1 cell adhesion molecule Dscam2-like isoform X2 [Panonychus citri]